MSFWEGFEKRSADVKGFATDVGVNTAIGGGVAALINAIARKPVVDAKGSALLSGGLSALFSSPKLLKKQSTARMRLATKALSRGNRRTSLMNNRPKANTATVSGFTPTALPSASGSKYKPQMTSPKVPSPAKLKMPSVPKKREMVAKPPKVTS